VIRFAFLSGLFLVGGTVIFGTPQRLENCLPSGTTMGDIVSITRVESTNTMKKITVEQKLDEIKARCESGKLVDGAGKQIRFYQLQGCWGNPPADYREILAQQEKELEKLRKEYRVIEMTCDPEGTMPH